MLWNVGETAAMAPSNLASTCFQMLCHVANSSNTQWVLLHIWGRRFPALPSDLRTPHFWFLILCDLAAVCLTFAFRLSAKSVFWNISFLFHFDIAGSYFGFAAFCFHHDVDLNRQKCNRIWYCNKYTTINHTVASAVYLKVWKHIHVDECRWI